jgi:uncharacterized damage-inducible protein DinB
MISYFQRGFRFMAWADTELINALASTPASQTEGLGLMAHILAAEHIWLHRILRKPTVWPVWPQWDLEECRVVARENELGFPSLLEGKSENDLNQPIFYQNTKGEAFSTPLVDLLTHAIVHGSYHRGQIAKAIAKTGGTPPNTDFITYARIVEPLPS